MIHSNGFAEDFFVFCITSDINQENNEWNLARYHRTDGRCVPIRIQQILAQATPDPGFQPVQPGQAVESGVDYVCKSLSKNLVRFIPNLPRGAL